MKKSLFIVTIMLLLNSCAEEKGVIEKIDFTSEYKFTSEIEEKLAKDTLDWKYQISASDYAINGDYKNALIQWDLAMGTKEEEFSKQEIDSIKLLYEKVKATDYIINQAENNQVIIINEAHHNSSHRVFTKSLLKGLYDKGYRNLGLEALAEGEYLDSTLNSRKYPILKTGYYIKDPQFGNLVREALEIGYTLFEYEDLSKGGGKPREIGQAKNIKQVIDSKPNEKFLIHCGFAHAMEGNYQSWGKAMAGRLTEFTGINPLTINQEFYSEKSDPKYNHPLLKVFSIKEPSVLIDKNGKPMQYEQGDAYTDIAVFHPNTEYIDNRPHWLFDHGNKKVDIELNDINIEFPVMVLAYNNGEDINLAVPIDILEVVSSTGKCVLALESGKYTIVLTNGTESVKFEQIVK